jgi:soluble lytic murein transglycosylase-like protein
MVTARAIVERCEQYRKWADLWYQEFPIDADIVLAVMAAESACIPDAVSMDGYGTIGLMQIRPQPWRLREELLYNVKWNTWQGMYVLYHSLHNTTHNPNQSMVKALAGYNCGWQSVEEGRCGQKGGYNYAYKVLFFWLPLVKGDL